MFNENTTNEDIELLSRMIAGRIRNEVFEYIHQHITDEEMGPIQDRMRGCVYEVLNGIRTTNEPRVGFETYREHLAELDLYPIDTTEYEVESIRRMIQGDAFGLPTKETGLEEWQMARKCREEAFSRKGPFSCEE